MHQARHIITDLIESRDFVGAYAQLQSIGATPDSAPALWELLGRRAREADIDNLAQTVQLSLWDAGIRSLDLALDLARDALAGGRTAEAALYLEESFGPEPDDEEARVLLAEALAPSAPARAIALLGARAVETARQAVFAVDALRSADRLSEAQELIDAALAQFPDDQRLMIRKARTLEGLNRIADALAVWDAAASRWPELAATGAVQAVRLLLRLERRGEALDRAAAALAGPMELGLRLQMADLLGQERVLAATLADAAANGFPGGEADQVAAWLHDRGMVGALAWLGPRGLSLPAAVGQAADLVLDPADAAALAAGPLDAAMQVRSPDRILPLPVDALARFRAELNRSPRPGRPILICNSTLTAGGAERQFVMLAEAILDAGVAPGDLHVALFSLVGDRGHRHFYPALERLGVQIHDLRSSPDSLAGFGPNTAAFIGCLPQPLRGDTAAILALAARLQPRLIHGWQDRAGLAAGLAGLLLGTPRVVMSARNMQPQRRGDRTPYARTLYRQLAARPGFTLTANATPGVQDYEAWLDLPSGRVERLGNALDIARFPLTAPAQAGQRPLNIGGVFRLAPNKRPDLWLSTIAALRDRMDGPVRPRLVGSGPLEPDLHRLAEDLGLAPLEIRSGLSAPEEIYGGLDCLLLMSRVEGTPNVVLEAQACGLPVAACDVGGVADALCQTGEAAGLLLPASVEPAAAAASLAAWLPDARTPAAAEARRRFVAAEYSKAAIGRRIAALYDGALAP